MKFQLTEDRVGGNDVYKSPCGNYRTYWDDAKNAWAVEYALPGRPWSRISTELWFRDAEFAARGHVPPQEENVVIAIYKGKEISRLSIPEGASIEDVSFKVHYHIPPVKEPQYPFLLWEGRG